MIHGIFIFTIIRLYNKDGRSGLGKPVIPLLVVAAAAGATMPPSAICGGRGMSTMATASSSPISSVASPFVVGSHHHHRHRPWPIQQQQHVKKRGDDNNNKGRRRKCSVDHKSPSSPKASFVVAASMTEICVGWIADGGSIVQNHLHHLFLGVGVGLPCTVMPCGDIIYRSTLPRSAGLSLTAPGVCLALSAVSYLWATPGVAPGFWDMFVLAFVERIFRPSFRKDNFILGKKLGEGAFGVVYRASLSKTCKYSNTRQGDLVVKKATEYGAVEIWMNERVRRACSSSCADFVYGFLESPSKGKGGEYWLVWDFEGEQTLADLMLSKEFPYNVETMIIGEVQNSPKGLDRENKIVQTIMRQLLFALDGLHSTGIVHRDIKPQNIIFSEGARSFKIIDLGAAADLRVGINYIPKEFLLDPRYAAPEQYIMSTQTPSAPSVPVATALSPVLWQMNLPDRFDIYSIGLIFLQMVFPSLRSDSGLIQFNRQLKRCEYDMEAWRKIVEPRASPELRMGFDLLDLNGGIGWELLTSMIRFKARQRTSAKGALAHPYFKREGLLGLSFMQNFRLQLFRATENDYSEVAKWIINLMARSGTKKEGGFTEAELQDLSDREPRKGTARRNALASALRLQRKIARTLNESMDELSKQRKSFWWTRWIPRQE